MTKSRRTRKLILYREGNISELGIQVPEHIKKMKNPRKHFALEEYKNELGIVMSTFSYISNLVGNPTNVPDKQKQIDAFNSQILLARSSVIQYFVVLDKAINNILAIHQTELRIPDQQVEMFTEPDVGLKKFLPKEKITPKFDAIYSKVKHFRILRNQFAHYSYGAFCLGAEKESFESFLGTLDGIKLDPNHGFHCYINGKTGMFIPYFSDSSQYINELITTGSEFYKNLLEIFLPDPTIIDAETH